MASSFPAYIASNIETGTFVAEYTPNAVTPPVVNDLVVINTGTGAVDRCGADPALIAGICEVITTPGFRPNSAQSLTPNGKVPIRITRPDALWAFSNLTGTLSDTNLGTSYGITRNATTGFWQFDTTKTGGSARFRLVRYDPVTDTAFAILLQANCQFSGV